MKNKEIERKFLIDPNKIPFDLDKMPYRDITQGYVTSIDRDLTFRLRHVLYRDKYSEPLGEDWFQTIKGKGSKVRDEYEFRLLREQFKKMWKLYEKLCLHKWRYDPPCEEGTMHLDQYKSELKGLWTVEVEFDSIEECDAYTPPNWFGEEVTEDMRYTNLSLTINGIPEGTKIYKD